MSASHAADEMVLGLLSDALGESISGEGLAQKLGLSPTDIYRRVESLRKQGYRINSNRGKGYRLVSVPDRLTPLEIEAFLSTHDIAREIHSHELLDSTNAEARRLAEEGALHGETVIAEQQSAGRGRRGRSWVSPPGVNLYLSVILRPECEAAIAPELTFVAGVAIAEGLRRAFNLPVDLKWPNDVVINGRKVAGILTELHSEGSRVSYVIVGLGLNVNMLQSDFPEEIAGQATSLREELGQHVDRPLLCAALLSGLEPWYDRWEAEGFAPVREMWETFSTTLQRPVRVLMGEGEQSMEGIAEGLDPSGALLVRRSNGVVEKVHAGEVVHLRPGAHASYD